MYGGDEEGMMDSSPFEGLFDEATLAKVDECGVDLDEIMNDYINAMMDAAMMDNEEDKVSFLFDFMENQLAEEGEMNCTEEQVAQYNDAGSDFLKCIGWNQEDFNSREMYDQIKENCEQIMDPSNAMMMQPDDEGLQRCLDTIMGDNPIGNFLRDLYHHPGKYCKCMASLDEATPECFVTLPNDVGRVPLSVVKKEICLLEIGCDAIDGFCEGEIQSLDECLPSLEDKSFSCLQVIEDCSLLSSPPISIVAPPELTMSELPDSCVRVHDESFPDTNVVERYTQFNDVCNNNGSTAKSQSLYTSPTESSDDKTVVNIPAVLLSIALISAVLIAVVVLIRKRRANALEFGPVCDDDAELI
jgi:hypothetical protein